MIEIVRVIGARLKEIGSVLWRCFYSVTLTVLGGAGFVLVPQGTEFLRLISQPGWNFPLFMVSVVAWSLAAWYSARLTLGRVFEGTSVIDRSDTAFVNAMRKWLPRLLGVLPSALLAFQFQRLGETSLALGCAGVALALCLFVLKRRNWFAGNFARQDGQAAPVRFGYLQRETVLTVVAAIALSFALLLAVWWQPVLVTTYLSAPVLLCFALASWILFGDLVLTYFVKQARLPSMAALPALLFVVCSLSNDNHGVDLSAAAKEPLIRHAVATRFEAWLDARLASGELKEGQEFPVFLVAAEGGGIRAAYWAGNVLAKLQDDSGARFGRHLFAVSGVSGGSLAGAVFAALMADAGSGALALAPCARGAPASLYQTCTRAVLRRDFLSPTVGYMLYPDMLQRLLPAPIPAADRARAMEKAWQAGWKDAVGNERFSQRFDRLWSGANALEVPSLLLNATLVDGGNRFIASDLALDASFPDAYDAFDPLLDLGAMSLATAVHNSARFSYVSPAGTVSACRHDGKLAPCVEGRERAPWGRVIDGGYFENSGVETVRDLLFALRPVLQKWSADNGGRFRIEPVVIVISNSPGAHAPSGKADPGQARMDMNFLSEVLAPPLGLYHTRTARATFAVYANSRDMGALVPNDTVRFFWFGLESKDPPLGWALADHTFDGMDRLLAGAATDALPFQAVLRKMPPR